MGKNLNSMNCIAVMLFVLAVCTQARAQQTATVPDTKMALIYSEAFLDPKTGITRFNSLIIALNQEFQPRQNELQALQQRIQTVTDEIEKTRNVAAPAALQQKIDQLEQMKRDFQRKGEDSQAAYDRRRKEVFTPLQDDIGKALEAFAKARGILMIIDGSQVPIVYAADAIDITRVFINDFNAKNPPTVASPPKQ